MTKPGDDLPALFRSLGPDDAGFQASTQAAAREAEQRWPLFKAVPPQKPPVTPALSAQERQHWSSTEKSETSERKPALSLPGLSDKLARSLGKMSGRVAADAPAQNPARRIESEPPPVTPPPSVRTRPPITPPDSRSILFSDSPKASQNVEADDSRLGLFATPAAKPSADERAAPAAEPVDDSLASIFSRLEEKEKPSNKSTDKRSSFLSRLGKR